MKFFKYISVILIFTACTNDDLANDDLLLSSYVSGRTIEKGAVIACAGSSLDASKVLVFQYPVSEAKTQKYMRLLI